MNEKKAQDWKRNWRKKSQKHAVNMKACLFHSVLLSLASDVQVPFQHFILASDTARFAHAQVPSSPPIPQDSANSVSFPPAAYITGDFYDHQLRPMTESKYSFNASTLSRESSSASCLNGYRSGSPGKPQQSNSNASRRASINRRQCADLLECGDYLVDQGAFGGVNDVPRDKQQLSSVFYK
jgi:hypothetical protein